MKRVLPLLAIVTVLALIAAPRPAQVIPSDSGKPPVSVGTGVEADPERTGAPLPSRATTTSAVVTSSDGASGAPRPSGGIGTAASYCKPGYCDTPEPRVVVSKGTGLSGPATWFAQAPYGTAAAGPRLRRYLGADWRGTRVSVRLPGCGCPAVVLVLTDWCACTPPNGPDRIIDLDDAAFAALAPLSVGVITVEVREVAP